MCVLPQRHCRASAVCCIQLSATPAEFRTPTKPSNYKGTPQIYTSCMSNCCYVTVQLEQWKGCHPSDPGTLVRGILQALLLSAPAQSTTTKSTSTKPAAAEKECMAASSFRSVHLHTVPDVVSIAQLRLKRGSISSCYRALTRGTEEACWLHRAPVPILRKGVCCWMGRSGALMSSNHASWWKKVA